MKPPTLARVHICNHHVQPDHVIDLEGARHLVITGPNGSGKTTILRDLWVEIDHYLAGGQQRIPRSRLQQRLDSYRRANDLKSVATIEQSLAAFRVEVDWAVSSDEVFEAHQGGAVVAYLPADRMHRMPTPSGPRSLGLDVKKSRSMNSQDLGEAFLQYLLNLFTSMHLYRADEPEEAARIESRIETLVDALRDLLVAPDLRLEYDKRSYKLDLFIGSHHQPWEHLAAGHRAALGIVADVYTRMYAVEGRSMESGGVVLIDEPELHLHPEMQERVLPALTALFPNLQFIVATHAPPVISSIPDAWVHDLRRREGISSSQLQGRPYGSLMTSHFQIPTDYDAATTRSVESLLEQAERATTPATIRAIRDELSGYLTTEDDRVLECWNRLTLALERSA